MILLIIGIALIILFGGIAIYLAFADDSDDLKKSKNVDIQNVDFFEELKNIDIKNEKILELKKNISKYIVGSENLINSILVSILANGHILVEGVPGLAKTKTILVLSKILGLDFKRVQFTPDMLPSDIIGGEIYNKNTGKFEIFQGPLFTNLLLADEINRTTPKVQAGLLEAMQEKSVTIGNNNFELEKPFFVMATQNPIEQEGTFPLPEAQLDRFLFKVIVNYPSFDEEKKILDSFDVNVDKIDSIFSAEDILNMQKDIKNISVGEKEKEYIIKLVNSTRQKDKKVSNGASPRGVIYIKLASMVVAYLEGRDSVLIEDIKKVSLLVLRHRVNLSYFGLSENVNIDELLVNKFIGIKDYYDIK